MKFFYLLLAFFAILSCNKNENLSIEGDSELYNVNFELNTFTSEITPMMKSEKILFKNIYYVIYDLNNEALKSKYMSKSHVDYKDMDFLTISEKLPKGEYKIGIVAHNECDFFLYNEYKISMFYAVNGGKNDYFSNSSDFKVNENVGLNTHNIILNRTMGSLQVNITDDLIPDTVSYVKIEICNFMSSFDLITQSSFGGYNYPIRIDKENINSTLFCSNFFEMPEGAKMNIKIKIYSNDDNVIAQTNINNIDILSNHKTILTGKIFNELSTEKEINIGVETEIDWASENIEIDF